jgi:hypothetical protein
MSMRISEKPGKIACFAKKDLIAFTMFMKYLRCKYYFIKVDNKKKKKKENE